jgi:hypothetical protein
MDWTGQPYLRVMSYVLTFFFFPLRITVGVRLGFGDSKVALMEFCLM